jgi:hypothetical protein
MFRSGSWLLIALLTASIASAQGVADSPDYTALIHEALAEFEDGNYPEARALFLRAHALQPSARTFRGLGVSAFALREYEDATSKLELALASPVKPLDPALRSEAQLLLERSYGFVGRYELGMEPTFAQLLVDGAESDVRAGQRLLLSIGHHQLEARAPAYESDKRTLDVAGGENTGLSFTLAKIPVEPIAIAPVAPPPVELVRPAPFVPLRDEAPHPPLYENPWLWTGVGVAVAALVIGVSVGATRDHGGVAAIRQTAHTPAMGVIEVP